MNVECSYFTLGAQSDISFSAVKSSDASEERNQKQRLDNSGSPPPNTMSESLTEMRLDAGFLFPKSFYPRYKNVLLLGALKLRSTSLR